jgi:hypothetical protein
MSRLKRIERYPVEYSELFLRAERDGSARVQCKTHNEASYLQRELYNFRTALRKAPSYYPSVVLFMDNIRIFVTRENTVELVSKTALREEMHRALFGEDANASP